MTDPIQLENVRQFFERNGYKGPELTSLMREYFEGPEDEKFGSRMDNICSIIDDDCVRMVFQKQMESHARDIANLLYASAQFSKGK